jgi:hypothetical protein
MSPPPKQLLVGTKIRIVTPRGKGKQNFMSAGVFQKLGMFQEAPT